MTAKRETRSGQKTKERILEAALETVTTVGLVNTSARVIARTGEFNQALVFYHFGSVEELLLAALERANVRRMERFRAQLEAIDDLAGLVEMATELHGHRNDRDVLAISAIVGGWSSSSDHRQQVLATLEPWNQLIAEALDRALVGSPIAPLLSTPELAYGMSALFLGVEMLAKLDPEDPRGEDLFAILGGLSRVAGPVMESMNPSD